MFALSDLQQNVFALPKLIFIFLDENHNKKLKIQY